jgi:hypothetical protein
MLTRRGVECCRQIRMLGQPEFGLGLLLLDVDAPILHVRPAHAPHGADALASVE